MLELLTLNIDGLGLATTLPLHPDDYIVSMVSEDVEGEEWVFIGTKDGRLFAAQANDAGGLNVRELHRA